MPNPTLHDTMSADFAAGSSTGTYAAETGDGELMLAPTKGTESGTTMPAGWATSIWSAGGSATVGGGKLTVDGARVATCVDVAGSGVRKTAPCCPAPRWNSWRPSPATRTSTRASDTPDDPAEPIALFSSSYTDIDGVFHFGRLDRRADVRRRRDQSTETRTNLGPGLINAPHRYRIDWLADRVVYYVDGVLAATHMVAVAAPMRPVAASDFNAFSGNIVVDWVRTTPYASSGTFLSRVFEGSTTGATWNNVSWIADVPAGTTLALSVRTGSTATPDATWTPFVAVTPGALSLQSRYIQYPCGAGDVRRADHAFVVGHPDQRRRAAAGSAATVGPDDYVRPAGAEEGW